jgi:hypothetical protein
MMRPSSTAALSDERVKTNLATITDALSINENLRPTYFDWKKENELGIKVGEAHSLGFIAQNIQKVFPNLDIVSTTTQKYLVLDYGKLTAILSAAISEIVNVKGLFKENLQLYLSDVQNGIQKITTREILVEKICLKDADGEICLNKKQVESIMSSHSSVTYAGIENTIDTTPEINVNVQENTETSTTTLETISSSSTNSIEINN